MTGSRLYHHWPATRIAIPIIEAVGLGRRAGSIYTDLLIIPMDSLPFMLRYLVFKYRLSNTLDYFPIEDRDLRNEVESLFDPGSKKLLQVHCTQPDFSYCYEFMKIFSNYFKYFKSFKIKNIIFTFFPKRITGQLQLQFKQLRI